MEVERSWSDSRCVRKCMEVKICLVVHYNDVWAGVYTVHAYMVHALMAQDAAW